MKKSFYFFGLIFVFILVSSFLFFPEGSIEDGRFLSYVADPKTADLKLYWKDSKGQNIYSLQRLKEIMAEQNRTLLFAMNGGMYKKDNTPQGLYIESSKVFSPLDTSSGKGNFYLKPNGVFYLTRENKAVVCKTQDFDMNNTISYATQSGPMLVIDGQIHPAFKEGSSNLNIRNGVGILQDGKVLFVMSKSEINFYDFARYFKEKGCKNALYLDGFVSRTYLPQEKWIQTDGNFGVIIGVSEKRGLSK